MKEKHSLKELRARYNLKQEEIAEIIGISHSRWSNLERDSTNIKINTALKISNFFNVPLELIFLVNYLIYQYQMRKEKIMRVIHTMLDGTVLDTLENRVIPRNKETKAYYQAMKKILIKQGEINNFYSHKQ